MKINQLINMVFDIFIAFIYFHYFKYIVQILLIDINTNINTKINTNINTYINKPLIQIQILNIAFNMSQLTQQQINQRRRQKILARTRKAQLDQQQNGYKSELIKENRNQQQTTPLLYTTYPTHNNSVQNEQKQEADAFKRFREFQMKIYKQKMLLVISKLLGLMVALIQFYFLSHIKNYDIKRSSNQINAQQFSKAQQRLLNEMNLVFWLCFCLIIFGWVWIKYITGPSNKNKQKFELIPGSGIVSALQQLNKVLQYKVLVKALLGYIFACIVVQFITNQLIISLGYENTFYKPDLVQILGNQPINMQNQQIL